MAALMSTGIQVADVIQSGLVAGADSPFRLSCVEPETHAQVAAWLICTRLKKVRLPILVQKIKLPSTVSLVRVSVLHRATQ